MQPALETAYARTKPGSTGRLIVEWVHQETLRLGRGPTVAELMETWPHRGTKALRATVTNAVARGVLEYTGGRYGHQQVALAGAKVPWDPTADDAYLVLQGLQKGWEETRKPLTTREVDRWARTLGCNLHEEHPNAVRQRLMSLARKPTRGPGADQAPAVIRVEAQDSSGRSVSLWIPGSAGSQPESRVDLSGSEIARLAVERCAEALGFPVSRRDVALWAQGLPKTDPVRSVLGPNKRAGGIGRTADADASRAPGPGILRSIPSVYTSRTGFPARFFVGEPTSCEVAAAQVLEALLVLRADEEVQGLQALDEHMERYGKLHLDIIGGARSAILRKVVHRAAEGEDPDRVASLIEGYLERREGIRPFRGQNGGRPTTLLDDLTAGYQVRLVLGSHAPRYAPAMAGTRGLVLLRDLEPVYAQSREFDGLDPTALRWQAKNARRFPLPPSWPEASESPTPVAVDRMEGILDLTRNLRSPIALSWLERAYFLIGSNLRDPELLTEIISMYPEMPVLDRGAITVALGCMGYAPDFEASVQNEDDTEGLEAWILGRSLANWDTAAEAIQGAIPHVLDADGEMIDRALLRLDAGAFASVVG